MSIYLTISFYPKLRRYVLSKSSRCPHKTLTITSLCNRPSGIYILTGFSEKNVIGWANFPPGCPFLSGRCFAFFKHTQIICAGYVKVAPGKPQTDRVKLKISPGIGKTKI